MKHGKNQQKKTHLKHLANKRLRQQTPPSQPKTFFDSWDDAMPSRPAQRTLGRVSNVPGFRQAAEAKRALLAYQAGYIRGLLEKVRDLLLRRIDDLNVAAFEADKAAGKDVSVIVFNKPAEAAEDWKDMKPLLQDGYTDLQGVVHLPVEPQDLMYCQFCKKQVIPVQWTSQPVKVCPDCGNVLDLEVGVDDKPATPAEVRKMVAAATQAPVKVVCPLCNHPITLDDAVLNSTVVKLNGRPVQVHKNCPCEGPVKSVGTKNSHKGEKNG